MTVTQAKQVFKNYLEKLMSLPKDPTSNAFIWLHYKILIRLNELDQESIESHEIVTIIHEKIMEISTFKDNEPFFKISGSIFDFSSSGVTDVLADKLPLTDWLSDAEIQSLVDKSIQNEAYELAEKYKRVLEDRRK